MNSNKLFKPYLKYILIYMLIIGLQVLLNLLMPELVAHILKDGILLGNKNSIYTNGFYMFIISIIIFSCSLIGIRFMTKITFNYAKDIRYELYKKFQKFSSLDIQKYGTSSYITRVTNDIDQISNVMTMALYILASAPITLIGATFMAIRINASISFIFLLLIPIMAIMTSVIVFFANPYFKLQREYTDKINKLVREFITGIRVIRAFNKEKTETKKFDKANIQFANSLFKANKHIALFPTIIPVISNLSSLAVMFLGAYLINKGELNIEYLISLQQYGMQVIIALIMMSFIMSMVPQALMAKRRIDEMFNQEIVVEDVKSSNILTNINSIEFNKVTYALDDAEYPLIRKVSFIVNKGETLAITGATGSGKSTIINNLVRLNRETSGEILINGENVDNFNLSSYKEKISYVPQMKKLFKGTIRSNMLIGKTDATNEEIIDALKQAGAYEFVEKLDGFLDAKVEKNGENFSGGQKQRLCMARALVKEADVYIFDDSFSALDYKTESLIRDNLNNYKKDSIKIIISQRQSSLMGADKVLLMQEGVLIDQGTHKDLLERNDTYKDIFAQVEEVEM
ncbi:ABC transporter ATP-binding protein [Gemella sp. GH3]|uniref:ABC transporter ATP-binding protein n=1 Tax=unclassified Gemella TaxID=2624949 RepID=UPI0015D0B924|nr:MULTISPECIES: ABC transporter ATP-binding protein [unclassified Gemella]MBF0713870.1 ABC transporter ATP-binding protein [Gemella sp. GH3.1]NYS50822.1 ABC transporter ATP-binding protein [Gemella sp. GH3]